MLQGPALREGFVADLVDAGREDQSPDSGVTKALLSQRIQSLVESDRAQVLSVNERAQPNCPNR